MFPNRQINRKKEEESEKEKDAEHGEGEDQMLENLERQDCPDFRTSSSVQASYEYIRFKSSLG
jgi:hypothetical protein